MAITSTSFGVLLRTLRKRVGMTQGDLAAAVGYSVSTISALEQEQRQPAVEFVVQQLVPALALADAPQLATRLVELAASARGERPPTSLTIQRSAQIVIQEEEVEPPRHLPLLPITLLGRTAQINQLCDRLLGHGGRLLTLVGPPGIGKTTLALAVAVQMQPHYRDGAVFVALAAISEPTLMASTIASAVGCSDTSPKPPKTKLIEFLRRKTILLVLDNLEQIVEAAPLIAELVAECPGVCVLATSRERLHLRAEQRYKVPPLDLAPAVELFVQRAQAVENDFCLMPHNQATIEAICQRLDCLPLAIELIAGRIDLFSPKTMLARLHDCALDLLADGPDDAPVRHRTLRNAIHRSYGLCNAEEQQLLRTLGVFVGGFDLAAVAHFGFAEATLQGLVHKNLVKVETSGADEPHFLLLETLRDYALEQLAQARETETVQRTHALYFFELTKHTHTMIYAVSAWDAKSVNALQQAHELDNVRATLRWIVTHEPALELSFLNYLYELWHAGAYIYEVFRWSEAAWRRIPPERTLDYAFFLCTIATIQVYHYGDFVTAQRYAEESLALYRQLQHPLRFVHILKVMAHIRQEQGDTVAALALIEEAVALSRAEGHPGKLAFTLLRLRAILLDLGEQSTARTLLHEIVALWRSHNGPGWQSQTLRILAQDAFLQGDLGLARAQCEEAIQLSQRIGETATMAESLLLLGQILWRQGDKARARAVLDELLPLAHAGNPTKLRAALLLAGLAAQENGEPQRSQALLSECLVLVLENHILQNKSSQAFVAYLLCGLAGLLEPSVQAAQLLGVASRLLTTASGLLYFVVEQNHYERILAVVQAQLDEATFTAAYAAGYAMTIDQAVAWALAHFVAPEQAA